MGNFRNITAIAGLLAISLATVWLLGVQSGRTARSMPAPVAPVSNPGMRVLLEQEVPVLNPVDKEVRRFHVDPNVRPVSAVVTAGAVAASVPAAGTDLGFTSVSQSLNAQTLKWPLQPHEDVERVAFVGDAELAGFSSGGTLKIQVNGGDAEAVNPTGNAWRHPVGLESGDNVIVISRWEGEQRKGESKLRLIAPTMDDEQLRLPEILRASNNLFAEPKSVDAEPVLIYGRFLRLEGRGVDPGTELRFRVFNKADGAYLGEASPQRSVIPESDGSWRAQMQLPQMKSGVQAIVLAYASRRDLDVHRYSDGTETGRLFVQQVIGTQRNPLSKPVITEIRLTEAAENVVPDKDNDRLVRVGQRKFFVKGTAAINSGVTEDDVRVVVLVNGIRSNEAVRLTSGEWVAPVEVDRDQELKIEATTVIGDLVSEERSEPFEVDVRTSGPAVDDIVASSPKLDSIKVIFDEPIRAADLDTADEVKAAFKLTSSNDQEQTPSNTSLTPDAENAVVLNYSALPPGVYTFKVIGSRIRNNLNKAMSGDHETRVFQPIDAELATTAPGIPGPTGPNVQFPEYTPPRPFMNGFNPSDHVETRVSRLYYYRDAHRVAQIVNRDVKSHNRAAVLMQEQLANKARQIADQATDDRRAKERQAIEAAKRSREAERELQQAEATAQNSASRAAGAVADLRQTESELIRANATGQDPRPLEDRATNIRNAVGTFEDVARVSRSRADILRGQVDQLREAEAQANEASQVAIATEDRAREEQFRREVAAANADPDTYAAGLPGSPDPVRQVSVSVIGEGLIQLRGPIKGINIIRTMINQIDAPVGQVRVGVHTVQINGERGDRMEKVAEEIQRYIDHSRFLTMQSAEMLRKAIVQVAAQKAMEVNSQPGVTQEQRDRKYLYAFFGQDFVRELEVMDSEFLMTGNKLLSIHSMDSTSLASALFLMSLAKNTTRLEILQVFEGMMAGELPMAEQAYFEAGFTCDGDKKGCRDKRQGEEFQLLSANARFQSIRGFFNVEIALADTMTPLQREFIRLAQIFKSRLIVEMELKQRVMERAVIEERLGDREKDLREAKAKEEQALKMLQRSQLAMRKAQTLVLESTNWLLAEVQTTVDAAQDSRAQTRLLSSQIRSLVDNVVIQVEKDAARDLFGDVDPISIEQFVKVLRALNNPVVNKRAEQLLKTRDQGVMTLLSPLPLDEKIETLATRLRSFQMELKVSLYQAYREYLTQQATGQKLSQAAERDLEKSKNKFLNKDSDLVLVLSLPKSNEQFHLRIKPNDEVVFEPADIKGKVQDELTKIASHADAILERLNKFQLDSYQQGLRKSGEARLKIVKESLGKALNVPDSDLLDAFHHSMVMLGDFSKLLDSLAERNSHIPGELRAIMTALNEVNPDVGVQYNRWTAVERDARDRFQNVASLKPATDSFQDLLKVNLDYQFALREAESARRPLDHKKFLDMLVDEMEDKFIELLEGTRAHTANVDGYIKRLMTALDDDFNTQFYYPAFRHIRRASQYYDVTLGQVETTTVLANNRSFAKVSPQATMEFDLPKRDIVLAEAINGAKATIDDIGALAQDPTFLALARMKGGQGTASPAVGTTGGLSTVRDVLPGLSTSTAEEVLGQQGPGGSRFGAALESLIPDPAIYKFETGTGFEIRPVIEPDGQAVVFDFNYMYTTNVREPVRADEKHLGRVKRHFVHTDVQLSNYELREVSRYTVALKASRTARGVPLLEDVPVVGVLFRPLPSDESSLQQNIILGQSTIFPTLFDLMGLRWAPAVSDLDSLRLVNDDFIVRNRRRTLMNRVFDHSSSKVDEFLRIPEGQRRMDLYRSQETIPTQHPNGYNGPGADLRDSQLREGYDPSRQPETPFAPGSSKEGSPYLPRRSFSESGDADGFPSPQLMPSQPSPLSPDSFGDPAGGGNPGHPHALEPVVTPHPNDGPANNQSSMYRATRADYAAAVAAARFDAQQVGYVPQQNPHQTRQQTDRQESDPRLRRLPDVRPVAPERRIVDRSAPGNMPAAPRQLPADLISR